MAASFICRRYLLNDEELSQTFDLLDHDKDGRLNRTEMGALLRTANVEPTRRELDLIFAEMNLDESGKVDKEAFVNYMRSPLINKITIGELEQYFKKIDTDNDGLINQAQLQQMLSTLANLHDEEVAEELFHISDQNERGHISFHEFLKMIRE